MAEVNAKKHKYAMGIMTEYTAMCACLDESNSVYDSVFIPSAAVSAFFTFGLFNNIFRKLL